jgi:hypothetical protein
MTSALRLSKKANANFLNTIFLNHLYGNAVSGVV